jgi:hypothetical protein
MQIEMKSTTQTRTPLYMGRKTKSKNNIGVEKRNSHKEK